MQTVLSILQAIGTIGGLLFALKFALVAYEDLTSMYQRRRARLNATYRRLP